MHRVFPLLYGITRTNSTNLNASQVALGLQVLKYATINYQLYKDMDYTYRQHLFINHQIPWPLSNLHQ